MQLLKRTEDIGFTDSGNIVLFQAVVPLLTSLSIHERKHARLLHQVSPYAAIEITGNSLQRCFWFLHQPAATTEILLHSPVQRGFSPDTAGQR